MSNREVSAGQVVRRPLAGRVALVTGAGRRHAIGAAVAQRLAADGAVVLLQSWEAHDVEQPWGADPDGPQWVLDRIRDAGGTAEHVSVDLSSSDSPRRLVAHAHDRFGRLDLLVANHARSSHQDLEHLTAAEIDLSFAVNTRATLLLVQAYAESHAGGSGRIVLFTSGQYRGAMPDELPYVASKGAVHQLCASVAAHLMPRGITVNCVDPGPNDTGWADAVMHAAVAGRSPGGRWGQPADAARLVAWLVSDEADWVTGQVLASDGGWSTRT